MFKILKGHGKIQGIIEALKLLLPAGAEALKNLHVLRLLKNRCQGLRLGIVVLSGIHRVDAEGLDGFLLLLRQGPDDPPLSI